MKDIHKLTGATFIGSTTLGITAAYYPDTALVVVSALVGAEMAAAAYKFYDLFLQKKAWIYKNKLFGNSRQCTNCGKETHNWMIVEAPNGDEVPVCGKRCALDLSGSMAEEKLGGVFGDLFKGDDL